MRVSVERKNIKFMPDSSRVVARFFMNGDLRTQNLVARILAMSDFQVNQTLEQTLRDFSRRHRNISRVFIKHCSNIQHIIEAMKVNYAELSEERKLLIGSYCTMEFALESAAFFNPSMIEDFDQTYLEEGEKRVIISFRATGEGHISSLVFRRGILDKNNDLHLMKIGKHIDKAEILHKKLYDKKRFIERLAEMDIPEKFSKAIMDRLPDRFEYYALKQEVSKILEYTNMIAERKIALQEITWLVDSFYDIEFKHDADISARVIFPISESESSGIEDARFVRFIDDDGTIKVFATYTAYNGHTILPKLLSTDDFYTFRIMPLHGDGAQNKNLALFPTKIKGKYAMLARIDGVNNYIMFSERTTLWKNPIPLQKPKYPWEFTQIGNCGSPLYTTEGWLIITHGVGPMRRYCIGASLFDLEDPTKEIGRLEEPLITPLENEREGYVPNVVYSCGAIIHNQSLILPYAVSDYSSTYAVVNLADLFSALKRR
ncbi:glycoside hydrolase family 130 protein [Salegentibacter sp. LM13S]|uniref:glycoside hydrolase family 130 protein n=1 Tax=Salegentibacter lacus TaxID=2873599 RepID=UPI001CCD9CA0|nr:glycoside hydrolase family 130 protein [Salegentibacter lacus]MBZ9632555.1 glycoside hydrolase family 130 protein [Salegentibacter lacus]